MGIDAPKSGKYNIPKVGITNPNATEKDLELAKKALENAKKASKTAVFSGTNAAVIDGRLGVGAKESGMTKGFRNLEEFLNKGGAKADGKFKGTSAAVIDGRLGVGAEESGMTKGFRNLEEFLNKGGAKADGKFKGVTAEQINKRLGIGQKSDITKYFSKLEAEQRLKHIKQLKFARYAKYGAWALGAAALVAGISYLLSDNKEDEKMTGMTLPDIDPKAPLPGNEEQPKDSSEVQALAGTPKAQEETPKSDKSEAENAGTPASSANQGVPTDSTETPVGPTYPSGNPIPVIPIPYPAGNAENPDDVEVVKPPYLPGVNPDAPAGETPAAQAPADEEENPAEIPDETPAAQVPVGEEENPAVPAGEEENPAEIPDGTPAAQAPAGEEENPAVPADNGKAPKAPEQKENTAPATTSANASETFGVVQNGDTIAKIAARHGVSEEDIINLNQDKLRTFRTAGGSTVRGFRVGTKLTLPENAKQVNGLKTRKEAIKAYEEAIIRNFDNIPQEMWNQVCTPAFRRKHNLGEYKNAA